MLMATKQQQQQHGPATLRLLLGKTRLFSWLHHRSLPAARTQPPIHLAACSISLNLLLFASPLLTATSESG